MDNAIRNLSKLEKPFKYCLNTIIQQINDAGLTIAGIIYIIFIMIIIIIIIILITMFIY